MLVDTAECAEAKLSVKPSTICYDLRQGQARAPSTLNAKAQRQSQSADGWSALLPVPSPVPSQRHVAETKQDRDPN
jgi:hypothetical protein